VIASNVLFLLNAIETIFLRASSALEFSHSLDPQLTFGQLWIPRCKTMMYHPLAGRERSMGKLDASELRSCQAHGPFEHGLVGDISDIAGPFGDPCVGAEEPHIMRQTRRVVQQMAYGNFRAPRGKLREIGWQAIFVA
jgi:hypothetical protein